MDRNCTIFIHGITAGSSKVKRSHQSYNNSNANTSALLPIISTTVTSSSNTLAPHTLEKYNTTCKKKTDSKHQLKLVVLQTPSRQGFRTTMNQYSTHKSRFCQSISNSKSIKAENYKEITVVTKKPTISRTALFPYEGAKSRQMEIILSSTMRPFANKQSPLYFCPYIKYMVCSYAGYRSLFESKRSVDNTPVQRIIEKKPNLTINRPSQLLRKTPDVRIKLPPIAETSTHYKDSIRVWYQPRESMRFSPIVIIRFEGVLGDYMRKRLWNPKTEELFVRPNMFSGIARLKQKFQVVVTCCLNPGQVSELMTLMKKKNALPDAIYVKLDCKPYSYSQTLVDFDLKTEKEQMERIIIVTSLELEKADIGSNDELINHLIIQKNSCCPDLPFVGEELKTLPSVIAVPNPRLQHHMTAIPFTHIVQILEAIAMTSLTDTQLQVGSLLKDIPYNNKTALKRTNWSEGFCKIVPTKELPLKFITTFKLQCKFEEELNLEKAIKGKIDRYKAKAYQKECNNVKAKVNEANENNKVSVKDLMLLQQLNDENAEIRKGIKKYYNQFYSTDENTFTKPSTNMECSRQYTHKLIIVPPDLFPTLPYHKISDRIY